MIDIPKLLRKLTNLSRLAVGTAGTPEGQNAARAMAKMVGSSGIEFEDDAFDVIEETCTVKYKYETDLVWLCAHVAQVEAKVTPTSAKFSGSRVCVNEAVAAYAKSRKAARSVVMSGLVGYMLAAFGKDHP